MHELTLLITTAIRTQAYHVLHLMTLSEDPCKNFDLSFDGNEVFVTPLMVASYLGDYKAAEILIRNLGEDWVDAVLSKARPCNQDCLDLAIEARDMAKLLHDESTAKLDETPPQDDSGVQKKLVDELAERLENSVKLVDRLVPMKQFALDEKKKRGTISFVKVLGSLALAALRILCFLVPIALCILCFYAFYTWPLRVVLVLTFLYVWLAPPYKLE